MQVSQLIFIAAVFGSSALAGQTTFDEGNVQSYKAVKKQFVAILSEVEKNIQAASGVEKTQSKALKTFKLKLQALETAATGTNSYETYMLGELATRFAVALEPIFDSFTEPLDSRYLNRCQAVKDKFQFQNNLKQTDGAVVKSEDRFAARLSKDLCP